MSGFSRTVSRRHPPCMREGHGFTHLPPPIHPDHRRRGRRPCAGRRRSLLSARLAAPHPKSSGIDHLVVVMMENRSFDHMMGWVPGADGRQAGLTYTDEFGTERATYPLAPDFQGCGHPDPDHSYEGGRIRVEQRCVRRLAARGGERRVRDWLLHGGRPSVLRGRRARLDHLRSVFLVDHGTDIP